jgi:hypothetical protein
VWGGGRLLAKGASEALSSVELHTFKFPKYRQGELAGTQATQMAQATPNSLSHTKWLSLSHTHTLLTYTLSSHTNGLSLSHTQTQTHTWLSLSLSLTHRHTHCRAKPNGCLSLFHTLCRAKPNIFLSLSLSFSNAAPTSGMEKIHHLLLSSVVLEDRMLQKRSTRLAPLLALWRGMICDHVGPHMCQRFCWKRVSI